jgi:pyruvate-formate lyase-activating enzyme
MKNERRIEILKERRELINNVSPSFCSAKWLQTTLYLQNGYNHSCHHPAPHKIPVEEILKNPAALHNSEFKKSQRQLMLDGVRPKECEYCWNIEDLDHEYFSDRHYKTADVWAWDRFEEIAKADPMQDVYPSYLEVSFSNACNFKCVYCSPEISSRWLEDIQQHGPYPTSQGNHDLIWLKQVERYPYKHSDDNPYVNAFWKWFPDAITHLKMFRITGGEPLMSKDVWQVFDYIKANPQPAMELAINTNLCVEDKLIDKFIDAVSSLKGSVKRVKVYTSLESTGLQAEYSRYGLTYTKWINNAKKILDNNINIAVMTTINVLSLPTFNQFIDLIMQMRGQYNTDILHNKITLAINYLRWPPYLSVKILNKDQRHLYAISIKEHCRQYLIQDNFAILSLEEWDQINRFCDYLMQDEDRTTDQIDFVKFVDETDKRRETNFKNTFPELVNFYDYIKSI